MARFAPSIFTVFYSNVWRTDHFDNLTIKGFKLHWCKSNYLVSAVQIHEGLRATLTFLCYPRPMQIVFAILRYFVAVAKCSQDQFIGPIIRTGYMYSVFYCQSNLFWPQGELVTKWSRVVSVNRVCN